MSSDQDKNGIETTAVEKEREALLSAVAGAKLDTLQERVAWILNHMSETRDSDIALQIEYWRTFEPDLLNGNYIALTNLYEAIRLTSIRRARAKIQNTYKLFQASPPVQKQRGTLEEEEYTKALEQRPSYPNVSVYADESGKTGQFLLVGSVWFLHAPEILSLTTKVNDWRKSRKFTDELHFQKVSAGNVTRYIQFVDIFLDAAATVSFKAISLEQKGGPKMPTALEDLYYFLLIRGIEHENDTGRALLPRLLWFVKDKESGSDELLLARIHERVTQASDTTFDGQLSTDKFFAVDSKNQPLVQVADLFTGSLNRIMNGSGTGTGPKDQLAKHFFERLGIAEGLPDSEQMGDMTVLLKL